MHLQLVPWLIKATLSVTLTRMCSSSTLNAISDADKIVSLPGQPEVSFGQYAGYITMDEKQQRALFYYFAEAKADLASNPLVLWLRGGPGCSSIGVGAFCEHGPFKTSGDLLLKNYYSWNKEANMLYLESPAGVVSDNVAFLRNWFEKFPGYQERDLFIIGELCSSMNAEFLLYLISLLPGHYVPQLAKLIVQSKLLNLKGIVQILCLLHMGNPLLKYNTNFNSRAEFFWSHGLISDATYESFNTLCNVSEALREISKFIGTYDVTLDVGLSTVSSQSTVLNKLRETEKIDVCIEDETIKYLNRKEVQEVLHARLVRVSTWTVVRYGFQNYEVPTFTILAELVKSGIPILVYSGDQDSAIPLLGARTLLHNLAKQLGLNKTVPYRVWFEQKQVAERTQVYGDILSYATIRGRSLVLFSSLLGGRPLPEGPLAESAVEKHN
ncbi:hypothetical protein ACJRO7_002215 [Eucalyptus globulus]|uniref:Serine carboxypeptidase-like 45 n=1 Tax=Eucalyptus globulus TaxID=34317 RepID=A0ABD3LTP4_EUCGL